MLSHSLRMFLFSTLVTASGLLPYVSIANAQTAAAATTAPAKSPVDMKLADSHDRIKRCAAVNEPSIRISCYDDYAIELGYITPSRAKADVEQLKRIGLWQITKTDDGRGTVQTQLRLDSSNKLPSSKGYERNVSLLIRCVPGKTEVVMDWKANVLQGRFMGIQKALVNYNTDGGDKIAEEWETSTDKLALFAPDPIAFSRALMNKKSMSFSFGSANNSTLNIAHFNIEGVETALDEIIKSCYSGPAQKP